jgi:DNA-binding LacI/PurR family transcriptional regulator
VTGSLLEDTTRAARFAGYQLAMRDHGLSALEADADDRPHELVAGSDGITAFVTGNDVLAVRLVDALEAAGVRVPAEVSVVGFDGIALGAHSRIALTTVALPRDELTTRGLELLLDRIHGPPGTAPPRLVTLPPTLVVRGSTARPRS